MSAIETITSSTAAMSDSVDRLTARRYARPALSDQPIVRLVPAALGEPRPTDAVREHWITGQAVS